MSALAAACGTDWQDTIVISVLALSAAAAYAAFRFTGGKHDGEHLNERLARHPDDPGA